MQRWSVSQHTATVFVRLALAAGSADDCGAAMAAGEAACRRLLVRAGGRG